MQVNRLAWMRLEGWGRPTAAPCFETHRSAKNAAMLLRLYVLPLKRRLTLDAVSRVTPDGPGQSLKQGG